ncbi:MAG: hypothetical protein LBH71_01095 [Oscillospiraceae bacterium]|jgi:hypothetical protein|nr:hypothetical protein [Oscillospiraceae bacterium]
MKIDKQRLIVLILLAVLLTVLMTGCMPSDVPSISEAGFFSGIWHGWIAPVSLIAALFTDARIYEVNNTGFFYDLGFYMSIVGGFGGLAFSRSRRKKRHRDR